MGDAMAIARSEVRLTTPPIFCGCAQEISLIMARRIGCHGLIHTLLYISAIHLAILIATLYAAPSSRPQPALKTLSRIGGVTYPAHWPQDCSACLPRNCGSTESTVCRCFWLLLRKLGFGIQFDWIGNRYRLVVAESQWEFLLVYSSITERWSWSSPAVQITSQLFGGNGCGCK